MCCQSRLQECLQERAELLQLQETTTKQREKEKIEFQRAKEAWDRQRRGLEREISRLQEDLRQSREKIVGMERKLEVVYEAEANNDCFSSLLLVIKVYK